MQFHPWVNRNEFLEMPDTEVKKFFRDWRKTDACPWYVKEQYLEDNGQHARGGAGPAGKKRNAQENGSGALPPDEYDAKIAAHDFTGAAVLQHQQRVALGEVGCYHWRMSSMRTQRMRTARRSTAAAAALRRSRIKRMIGRHKC